MYCTKDKQIIYEFEKKSKSKKNIHLTLWIVQNELERLKDLESHDDSFKFEELIITNKPFINQIDDHGWFVFSLDVQAIITVLGAAELVGSQKKALRGHFVQAYDAGGDAPGRD